MSRRLFAFLMILGSLAATLHAQEAPTLKTQTIDGVEYYVYHVKPGEGLYRIGVNFGVAQEEITRLNPEIKEGLKAGQILFIPKKPGLQPTRTGAPAPAQPAGNGAKTAHPPLPVDLIASSLGAQPADAPAPKAAPQAKHAAPTDEEEPHFYYHKVLKKQTLYSLARQYGVRQEDITRYNPEAASGLRENEVLRIPKPEDIYPDRKKAKLQEDLSVKYLVHRVEAKETLYSISKRHAVEIADIMRLNPGLEVLTIGQELKIPYYDALMATDTVDGKRQTYIDWGRLTPRKDTVRTARLRLAFLLPFLLDQPEDPAATRFVDFYGGAVKALAEARAQGLSIDVYTYDTGKTPERMRELLAANPELREMDLIVGPAYSAQVPLATAFAREHRVKTLIPFTSKVDDIARNPYIFQFNPGTDAELEFLEYMLTTRLKGMNYIFADLPYVPETDEGAVTSRHLRALLDSTQTKYQTLLLDDPTVNLFDSAAVYSKRNLVIFNTDQFRAVQPYFENLNLTDRRYDLMLLERYSWKNQNTPRPVGVYVSPFKTEADIAGLETYEASFTDCLGWKAKAYNPRYDLLGYDLLSYFIALLTADDADIDQRLELDMHLDGLQSQFRFRRTSTGAGFVNRRVYLGDSQVR